MMRSIFLLFCGCAGLAGQSMTPQQTAYEALGCGGFFHFNMSTFIANTNYLGVAGWAAPNQAVSTFSPTVPVATFEANVDAWMTMLANAGCGYAILTTKHHDGFKLWNSASHVGTNPVYGVGSTSWSSSNGSPDIVNIFVTSARAHGIKPGLYYSILDRTFEVQNNALNGHCVLNNTSQSAACYTDYMAMINTELTELLSNYGSIVSIWTDGWGWYFTTPYTSLNFSTIYSLIKGLQANTLLVENNHIQDACRSGVTCGTAGSSWVSGGAVVANTDLAVWEVPNAASSGAPSPSNTIPSEAADVIKWGDSYWFYNSGTPNAYGAAALQSSRFQKLQRAALNAVTTTSLLDVHARLDGSLPPAEITAFQGRSLAAGTNFASGATVTASSTYPAGATTVVTNGWVDDRQPTCCAQLYSTATTDSGTFPTLVPFIQVDLGGLHTISTVELFNRTDNFGTSTADAGRIRDLTVTLYDATPTQVLQVTGINTGNNGYAPSGYVGDGTYLNGPMYLTIPVTPTSARYVKVSRSSDAGATGDDKATFPLTEITALGAASCSISITSPAGAAILSGYQFTLTAVVTACPTARTVKWSVLGDLDHYSTTHSGAIWTYNWNPYYTNNGSDHTITAYVLDATNAVIATSAAVGFQTANPLPFSTSDTVSCSYGTSPSSNWSAVVNTTVTASGTQASANKTLYHFVDGFQVNSISGTTAALSISTPTIRYPNGSHLLVWVMAENIGTWTAIGSCEKTVTFSN